MWRWREEIDRSSMFEEIVGSSEALGKVLRKSPKVAPVDSTVLILVRRGRARSLSLGPFTSDRNVRVELLFAWIARRIPTALIRLRIVQVTRKALSRRACKGIWGGLSWPTVERSSWTRSANCQPRRRAPYCAYSRKGSLNASVAATHVPWTCACSPLPTANLKAAVAAVHSAKISSTTERVPNPGAAAKPTGGTTFHLLVEYLIDRYARKPARRSGK